jgi:hypothetical protein
MICARNGKKEAPGTRVAGLFLILSGTCLSITWASDPDTDSRTPGTRPGLRTDSAPRRSCALVTGPCIRRRPCVQPAGRHLSLGLPSSRAPPPASWRAGPLPTCGASVDVGTLDHRTFSARWQCRAIHRLHLLATDMQRATSLDHVARAGDALLENRGLNTITRRGAMGASVPVLGLRPIRGPFLRTTKEPNEESFTSRQSAISSSTNPTSVADSARDSPTFL